MLTIFTTAKAFTGHYGLIQRNALASWKALRPEPQIILLGDDQGSEETARELGIEHIPDIARNEFGTPLIADMFRRAEAAARYDVMCFVNADIILLPSVYTAAEAVRQRFTRFLVVGRRTDLDVIDTIDTTDAAWARKLRARARREGRLRSPINIDCFIFSKGLYPEIPAFAIGRMCYDNWLIWSASDRGVPVVDMTSCTRLIHQNHDYSHAGSEESIWRGPEVARSRALLGHWSHYHSVFHARWIVRASGDVEPARALSHRLAHQYRWASHQLRFTRRLRRRLRGEPSVRAGTSRT
jgi:hypothetical protein